MLTLGSLFDGIGGFPLSGAMHGIKPIWASEIEPFPILVTTKRFPEMRHVGSVTDIRGDEAETVDILTFGSPCQDLSVAGAQKGIHEGARSSLFFEAVRIIKEMRNNDKSTGRTGKHVRPRFAVWENVPGAYSSNKGRDFGAVLQALCEVADPDVHVPFPESGKWQKAGCIVGDGYSIAWRTLDAQYFPRTPQRRKRIYLVADFGSERAGEILFKPHSVRGNPAEGGKTRQGTAEDAQGCAGGSGGVKCLNPWDPQSKRQYDINGVYRTLDAGNAQSGQAHGVCYAIDAMASNSWKSSNPNSGVHETKTARCLDTSGGNPACNQGGIVICASGFSDSTGERAQGGIEYCEENSATLKAGDVRSVVYAIEGNGQRESHKGDGWAESDQMYTLNTVERHAVVYDARGNGNGGGGTDNDR